MDNLIALPRMSEFLLDEFMIPMNITARDLAEGANIPIEDVKALLSDEVEITPELSQKLGCFLGVSCMLFYDIQCDLKDRAGILELQYA